jgi:hypothetical protein
MLRSLVSSKKFSTSSTSPSWVSIDEAAKRFGRVEHYKHILKTLKKQKGPTCIPHTIGALKTLTGQTKTKSTYGTLKYADARAISSAHPFVMIGKGITGVGTNYTDHHAIMILEIDEDGEVCIVDLDDTVKGTMDEQIIRIEKMQKLLENFIPDKQQMPDFEGNANVPLESIVEPGGSGSDFCVIL